MKAGGLKTNPTQRRKRLHTIIALDALDASSVIIESNGTESKEPIYDEEPMAEEATILGKPVGQPLKNQSIVRQPTAFKSERPRISKPRFASQVDVNNDLSKPVTTHHLPKGRESALAKPHHMIAPAHQAPFLNVQMTSVHINSGLVLHQMTSDHNRSDTHTNSQTTIHGTVKFKAGSNKLFIKQIRRYITTRGWNTFHTTDAMLLTTGVIVNSFTGLEQRAVDTLRDGLPMVAWPLYAKQKMNKVYLVQEMKVALG
ncbi:hypothetical protein Tco_1538671 [Tanacetum coccineum]